MRQFDQANTAPATLLRRLGAMFYDTLIVIALFFLVGFIGVALQGGEAAEGPLFKSTLFITLFLFFGFFWTRNGQTLGMIAWRIRVQTDSGYSISWRQALIRFFGAMLSAGCFGIGYGWILLSDNRQSWHDKLSDSQIVYLPKQK